MNDLRKEQKRFTFGDLVQVLIGGIVLVYGLSALGHQSDQIRELQQEKQTIQTQRDTAFQMIDKLRGFNQ